MKALHVRADQCSGFYPWKESLSSLVMMLLRGPVYVVRRVCWWEEVKKK